MYRVYPERCEDFEGKLSALGAVIAKVDSERELQKFKLKIG